MKSGDQCNDLREAEAEPASSARRACKEGLGPEQGCCAREMVGGGP